MPEKRRKNNTGQALRQWAVFAGVISLSLACGYASQYLIADYKNTIRTVDVEESSFLETGVTDGKIELAPWSEAESADPVEDTDLEDDTDEVFRQFGLSLLWAMQEQSDIGKFDVPDSVAAYTSMDEDTGRIFYRDVPVKLQGEDGGGTCLFSMVLSDLYGLEYFSLTADQEETDLLSQAELSQRETKLEEDLDELKNYLSDSMDGMIMDGEYEYEQDGNAEAAETYGLADLSADNCFNHFIGVLQWVSESLGWETYLEPVLISMENYLYLLPSMDDVEILYNQGVYLIVLEDAQDQEGNRMVLIYDPLIDAITGFSLQQTS